MGTSDSTSINWEKMFHKYETIIAGNDESLRVHATVKLGHMSKHAPESILACAVPVLVELLRGPFDNQNPSIQEAAAFCLKRIACHGDGRLALIIGQCGAISTLMSLLPISEGRLQTVVLKCLRNLVMFNDSNRPMVVRNGGLKIILDMLETSSGGLKRLLLEVLSPLSLLREVRRDIFNSGCAHFLVESAKDGCMPSRIRAAQAIGLLGLVKRARGPLFHSGAPAALMELIRDGDSEAKLVAGNALGVVSSHVNFIRPVARAGVIPIYAEILERSELLGKEISADVFCILAVAEENAVEIFQHLVRILREGDDPGKAAAAEIVTVLASYKHLASILQNSGAIPILVELLRDSTGDVQEKVTGAVGELSFEKKGRIALADSGAIEILIQMLEGECEELREIVAESLVRFSEDPILRDRVSCVANSPLLRNVRSRMMHIRASEAYSDSTLIELSIRHLNWDSMLL